MQQQTALLIRDAKRLYKSCLLCQLPEIKPQIRDKLLIRLSEVIDSEPLAQYRLNQLITKLQKL